MVDGRINPTLSIALLGATIGLLFFVTSQITYNTASIENINTNISTLETKIAGVETKIETKIAGVETKIDSVGKQLAFLTGKLSTNGSPYNNTITTTNP